MTRPSTNRRIASAVLGVGRASARPTGAPRRAELPLGRRVLAALLGIRVSAPQRSEAAPVNRPPRTPSSRTAPHLLAEDRADFEQLLDGVLRSAPERPELSAVGQFVHTEQLRTMATNASALIAAAAAAEYDHYVKVRSEVRSPAQPDDAVAVGASGSAHLALGPARMESGSGLFAVFAVLVPVLAGTAAAIFLLIGYVLKMLTPEPDFADAMIGAGWFFGAVTAAGLLAGAVGLVVTALRHGLPAAKAEPRTGREDEVARAREAWRRALQERGIEPFLRDAVAESDPGADPRTRGGAIPSVPPLRYAARPDSPAPEHETE
ncbi:hypothetical protein AB0O76_36035 [Streptomyces sp. NPDC086554]|uniref:hypothetical protein n=1 Tax=Streptomyces sp. NPDC086554 TaxID=3154864 RepID=UPI003427B53F